MRIRIFALVLGAVLLLSACGPRPAPAESGSGTVSGAASSGSSREEVLPAYFGDWKVTACLGISPASAMSREEADGCVGLAVSYKEDSFTAEGTACQFQPGTAYAEDVITAEEFQTACQLELSELGVSASMLLHVTVNIEGETGQNRLLGRDFFVLGGDSLLIYCDGAFFQAERTE